MAKRLEDWEFGTRDLAWFFVLAQFQNVTEAASHLGISQPTLSRSLSRLERHLGTDLFDRTGKGVFLNRYGRIFLDHAHRAIEELAHGETLIAELVDPPYAEIALGCQSWLGRSFVPKLVGNFLKVLPEAKFSLRSAKGTELGEFLERGVIDLVVSSTRPRSPAVWRVIASVDLYLVVPKDHRLASCSEIKLAEVRGESFVMPFAGLRNSIDVLCSNAGFTPKVVSESFDTSTIQGLVAAGLGVAILRDDGGAKSRNDLVYVPLSDEGSQREVGLAWLDSKPLAPVVCRFRDELLSSSSEVWNHQF